MVQLHEQDDLRVAARIVGCAPDAVHIGLPVQSANDGGEGLLFAPAEHCR